MELTFMELDNIDNNENQNDYNTYYDNLITEKNTQQLLSQDKNNYKNLMINQNKNNNQKPLINTSIKHMEKNKRKSLSYDDILASMNTVVIDGKLEFIRKDALQNIMENSQHNIHNIHNIQNQQKKRVTFNEIQTKNNQQQQQIDKSSYIYNKFFKGYKDTNVNQIDNDQPQRPLTKNELIKHLIINKANSINERNRIAQIKSTKLLFNNNNNRNIIINTMQNNNTLNHLFKYK